MIRVGLYFWVLMATALTSCNLKRNESKDISGLDTIAWILDTSILPSSKREYFDDYSFSLYKNKEVLSGGVILGTYEVRSDTFIILQDSAKMSATGSGTLFLGIIKKSNKDSLVIERIMGQIDFYPDYVPHSFPAIRTYKFYSDELNRDTNFVLNRICYSSSTCYGTCPALSFEIDAQSNVKYYGVEFVKKKGFYTGRTRTNLVKKATQILSKYRFKTESEAFSIPVDAPIMEILVYYNNGKKYFARGTFSTFPRRIQALVFLFSNIEDNCELKKTDTLKFETNASIPPPVIETQKFVPPQASLKNP